MTKKAVVLLSGGLDSTTVLAMAKKEGYACYALSFAYGQRHSIEISAAKRIAKAYGCVEHCILPIDLTVFGGSALTDPLIAVPQEASLGIPVTYVPARNTIFLAYALAYAEVRQADTIFIGVNAVDYSGYPDCRPAYIQAFAAMANLATKSAIEGNKISIQTPLIHLSKAEIIKSGLALSVDYTQTVSCYQADTQGKACGRCESCRLRKQGFLDAGVVDMTHYQG